MDPGDRQDGDGVEGAQVVWAGLHQQSHLPATAGVSAWAGAHSAMVLSLGDSLGMGWGSGDPMATYLTQHFLHSSAAHHPQTGLSPWLPVQPPSHPAAPQHSTGGGGADPAPPASTGDSGVAMAQSRTGGDRGRGPH